MICVILGYDLIDQVAAVEICDPKDVYDVSIIVKAKRDVAYVCSYLKELVELPHHKAINHDKKQREEGKET